MSAAPGETTIRVGAREVSVSVHGEGETAFVLAHGAGGNRRAPLLITVAEGLAAAGHRAVLMNFPYSEEKRRLPDPPALLEATLDAVASYAESTLGARRVILGGKSMGGRMASQLVARGRAAAGLVFLGYPLHAPGRMDALRDAHLDRIAPPMLFIQGTRDAFARWDLLETVAARLPRATVHRVEDGDHSFRVLKRTGRTPAEVEASIVSAIAGWTARLQSGVI
jgi:predicted alpha/beta-hydrolase family hydrolase